MQFNTHPTASTRQDAGSLLSLAQRSTELRSKAALRQWLRYEVQPFIPHAFLVMAWGDLSAANVSHEVMSIHPLLDADLDREMAGQVATIFRRWVAADRAPICLAAEDLVPCAGGTGWPSEARHVLAHGLTDHRGAYDCLYAFFGPEALCTPGSRDASRVLLPFIDAGFRQLTFTVDPQESGNTLSAFELRRTPVVKTFVAPQESAADLSARELEVMKWVRMGKTNSEIGSILDLSTFTVKNHMRRIYKKLDVMNRAQAVGCLERRDGLR